MVNSEEFSKSDGGLTLTILLAWYHSLRSTMYIAAMCGSRIIRREREPSLARARASTLLEVAFTLGLREEGDVKGKGLPSELDRDFDALVTSTLLSGLMMSALRSTSLASVSPESAGKGAPSDEALATA